MLQILSFIVVLVNHVSIVCSYGSFGTTQTWKWGMVRYQETISMLR